MDQRTGERPKTFKEKADDVARRALKWVGLAFVALLVLVLVAECVGGSEDDEGEKRDSASETSEPADETPAEDEPSEEPESEPESESPIDPAAIEADFLEQIPGRTIADMCDPAFTHWACFYDGIERHNDAAILLNLTTDGGWSDGDLEDLADAAALHWFNFVGGANPDLDYIVTYVNGRDRGTLRRDDVPLLN